jgi:hypothetical protein
VIFQARSKAWEHRAQCCLRTQAALLPKRQAKCSAGCGRWESGKDGGEGRKGHAGPCVSCWRALTSLYCREPEKDGKVSGLRFMFERIHFNHLAEVWWQVCRVARSPSG